MKIIIDDNDSETRQTLFLGMFHRNKLRAYAKSLGIPRGNDKQETIDHLVASGKVRIIINTK